MNYTYPGSTAEQRQEYERLQQLDKTCNPRNTLKHLHHCLIQSNPTQSQMNDIVMYCHLEQTEHWRRVMHMKKRRGMWVARKKEIIAGRSGAERARRKQGAEYMELTKLMDDQHIPHPVLQLPRLKDYRLYESNLPLQEEELTMSRNDDRRKDRKGKLQTQTLWTDATGCTKDIGDLETDHIINIVALIQRRITALREVIELTGATKATLRVDAAEAQIHTFLKELESRNEEVSETFKAAMREELKSMGVEFK